MGPYMTDSTMMRAYDAEAENRRGLIDLADTFVKYNDGGLDIDEFQKYLYEIKNQPFWRYNADIEADYYDGNQLDTKTLAEMEMLGIAPLITNLIAPTVDTVLGMEAKNRVDWRVAPDEDDDNEDFAEALNVKLHEAERISNVDRAISDAYAGQIKTGCHFVEVSREFDPFKPKYRVKAVHRREMYWDWFAKEPDLSDARYMIRKRWHDLRLVLMMFPKHAEVIKNAMTGWDQFHYELTEDQQNTFLARHWGVQQNTNIEEQEWLDSELDRLCLHECWYRRWMKGRILRLPKDVVIEYDEKNPRHKVAVEAGIIKPQPAILNKVRLSWWVGPHKLADIPTPYSHNYFPYVPFFGKREDRTGVPYGLIRSMKSPQDEVNTRKQKMMWLLSAKRVVADEDAVHDHNVAAAEVSRPDAYIKLNKSRLNKTNTAFQVDDNLQLSEQQFKVMVEAKQEIQEAGGVYQQMLGRNEGGASVKSGVAIDSLVEQGTITLAEINDNYRHSRRMVGDLLLSLVKDDMGDIPIIVTIHKGTERERKVSINEMKQNPETGAMYRTNDVVRTKAVVVLEDIPNTPTYRAQQHRDLTELTKSLPPELQAAIIDMVIESSDLARRKEVADRLRAVTGQGKKPEDMTEEERQVVEEMKAFEKEMRDLQLREQKAKTAKAESEAPLNQAKTEKTMAETAAIEQKTDNEIDNHMIGVAQGAKALTEQPKEAKRPGE